MGFKNQENVTLSLCNNVTIRIFNLRKWYIRIYNNYNYYIFIYYSLHFGRGLMLQSYIVTM
jgi:hypothetical protein